MQNALCMENEAVYRITKTKNLGKLEFPRFYVEPLVGLEPTTC